MRVKLLEDMYGNEGKRIRIEVNGKETTRRVKYNSRDGLYILVNNTKLFEYDFRESDVFTYDFIKEDILRDIESFKKERISL